MLTNFPFQIILFLQIKDAQKREDAFNALIIRHLSNSSPPGKQGLSEFASALRGINATEFSLENLNIEPQYYKWPFDELFDEEDGGGGENSSRKICFYCKK